MLAMPLMIKQEQIPSRLPIYRLQEEQRMQDVRIPKLMQEYSSTRQKGHKVDKGKDGLTNSHKDGTSQKMSYTIIYLYSN